MMEASICIGRVMHRRVRPTAHQFGYGVFFLRVPLAVLATPQSIDAKWFSVDRFNLLSIRIADYGARDGGSLETWARALLDKHGITQADGEIVLQTFPRLLGYVFNPISLFYCFDKSGALRATICEVNNTFGDHHHYLVAHDDARAIEANDWLSARKLLHVSPFCEVRGHYRFRFEQTSARAFAQIDYYDGALDADKLIVTTLHGEPRPLTAAASLGAFLAYPLMTISVIARIHWQAFKLWRKRVPFFANPPPLHATPAVTLPSPQHPSAP
jgi:uncharacterized protein